MPAGRVGEVQEDQYVLGGEPKPTVETIETLSDYVREKSRRIAASSGDAIVALAVLELAKQMSFVGDQLKTIATYMSFKSGSR